MKVDRLISLNAAIDSMMKLQTEDIETYGASIPEGFDGDRAIMALKALPTVDAVPVVRGRWRTCSDTQCGISCSVCGMPVDDFCGSIDYINLEYEPNFCPHCGARMVNDG